MRTLRICLLSVFLAGSTVVAQTSPQPKFAILEVGNFHGNEVALEQAREWVGVFCANNACLTRQVVLATKRVADELLDEDATKPTGTSIGLEDGAQPQFLVRGVAAAGGTLSTAFSGELNLMAGDKKNFKVGGMDYLLRVEGAGTKEDPLPKGSKLVIGNGSLSQELFMVPEGGDDPYIMLYWVGDIDGDGKPDFYLNTSWHYNVTHRVLWLSSLAKPGQLLGQAAVFETTGC